MSALAVHKKLPLRRGFTKMELKKKVPSDVIKHVKLGNNKWRNL
jgi:hypothetical protein